MSNRLFRWEENSRTTRSTTEHKRGVRLWAVLIWILVWQGASMLLARAYPHGALLLASPLDAAARLFTLARTAAFWLTVGRSILRIMGGFAASCLTALLLAALSARFSLIRELLAPLIAAVRATPVVSFIILAFVWMPSRNLAFWISALIGFPVFYGNLLTGIQSTDAKLLEMGKVFRVPFLRVLRGIYVPQVFPYFQTACSLGMGLCWKSGVAAEVIALPAGTIGERLYQAKIYFETPDLFAWTFMIVALSVLGEKLLLRGIGALAGRLSR